MRWYQLSGFADEARDDLAGQITVFSQWGIRYLEPRGVDGKNITDLTLDEAKAMKKSLDEAGMAVSSIGSPIGKINITDPFDDDLARLKHTLELAKILDTKFIRLFSFFVDEEQPLVYRDEVLRRMDCYAQTAKGTGITLLHENEGGAIYGQTAARCVDMFESVGSDCLKAVFDPGNSVYAEQDALAEFVILEPYISYLHVKDCAGDKVIVPPGEGKVQYIEILKRLKKTHNNLFLSLEPHLTDFESLSSFDPHLRLEKGDREGKFAYALRCLQNLLKQVECAEERFE